MRDLATLQIQLHNYEGFNETSGKLLEARPQFKAYWLGFAVSFELLGRFDLAEKVVHVFNDSTKDQKIAPSPLADYEESEVIMYVNHLIEMNGDFQRAMDHLETKRAFIKDTTAWREAKGNYSLTKRDYL